MRFFRFPFWLLILLAFIAGGFIGECARGEEVPRITLGLEAQKMGCISWRWEENRSYTTLLIMEGIDARQLPLCSDELLAAVLGAAIEKYVGPVDLYCLERKRIIHVRSVCHVMDVTISWPPEAEGWRVWDWCDGSLIVATGHDGGTPPGGIDMARYSGCVSTATNAWCDLRQKPGQLILRECLPGTARVVIGLSFFADGFESGDTSAWSGVVP